MAKEALTLQECWHGCALFPGQGIIPQIKADVAVMMAYRRH